jgi:predicted HicB family RNase H-like nuclease
MYDACMQQARVTLTLRIPPDVARELNKLREAQSMNAYVTEMLASLVRLSATERKRWRRK